MEESVGSLEKQTAPRFDRSGLCIHLVLPGYTEHHRTKVQAESNDAFIFVLHLHGLVVVSCSTGVTTAVHVESKPWHASVQTKIAAKLFSFTLEYIAYGYG